MPKEKKKDGLESINEALARQKLERFKYIVRGLTSQQGARDDREISDLSGARLDSAHSAQDSTIRKLRSLKKHQQKRNKARPDSLSSAEKDLDMKTRDLIIGIGFEKLNKILKKKFKEKFNKGEVKTKPELKRPKKTKNAKKKIRNT